MSRPRTVRTLIHFGIWVALGMSAPAGGRVAGAESRSNQILYYLPHTHWEGAVFKTREGYLAMGLPNILQALHLLETYPEYKFTLDQVAYIKPFLERYPEHEAAFRKFIRQGRLGIVGGMDVMPDDVKPGGELFVRQVQYGKQYCRDKLGVEVTTGWFLDTFGHHPQMPQLLRLAGFKSFWFCRGVPHNRLPSEFLWEGIDGATIPAFWLPGFYGLFYGPPRQLPQFARFFQERFATLNGHAAGPERVGLAGVDVSAPEEYVPPLIAAFNASPDAPFTIRYSVPSEFEAVVAKRPPLPRVAADFNPIFQGTYSSRIELKQTTRELEQRLLTAEKLSAVARWLGGPVDQPMLWRAWEPVLFNQTHDLASGVMTDTVYEDTVRSYDFSRRLADELVESSWASIAPNIDTSGPGIPIMVFNPLGWPRTDLVETELGLLDGETKDFAVVDWTGRPVPVQVRQTEHDHDGGLKRAEIAFVAANVPAVGYSVYRVLPTRTAVGGRVIESQATNVIENEFYRLRFDLATGSITSLFDKSSNSEVLAGPANVVCRQQDKGDLWELYRGLDGGSYVAMTNRQAVPSPGDSLLSSQERGTNGLVRRGSVFSEMAVSHPLGNGSFATRVRLSAGLRRIEFQTELINREKWVRYQVLFPSVIPHGHNVQEIPFGALERPVGIEFPAQNWVDYGDGQRGVALLNRGLPGNLVADGTLLLSLMRAHNLGRYGFGGGYEPGMSSETGFELDKPLTFHYALLPHAGGWRGARVYREGWEFNQPLVVHKAAAHAGKLPRHWGFLEISPTHVVLTALKPGAGGTTIVRLYEAGGQPSAGVKLKLAARIASAREANLLEDPGHDLRVRDNSIQFDLHPFEIKTLVLQLSPRR